jgi:hypothetical protein
VKIFNDRARLIFETCSTAMEIMMIFSIEIITVEEVPMSGL